MIREMGNCALQGRMYSVKTKLYYAPTDYRDQNEFIKALS